MAIQEALEKIEIPASLHEDADVSEAEELSLTSTPSQPSPDVSEMEE